MKKRKSSSARVNRRPVRVQSYAEYLRSHKKNASLRSFTAKYRRYGLSSAEIQKKWKGSAGKEWRKPLTSAQHARWNRFLQRLDEVKRTPRRKHERQKSYVARVDREIAQRAAARSRRKKTR